MFFFTSPKYSVSSCLSQMMSLKNPLIFQTAVSWLPNGTEPRTRHNIPNRVWAVQQTDFSLPWVQDSTSAYLCTYFFSQTYWTCRLKSPLLYSCYTYVPTSSASCLWSWLLDPSVICTVPTKSQIHFSESKIEVMLLMKKF